MENDAIIGDGIRAGLTRQGFCVDWFTDDPTGRDAIEAVEYNVVVLDLSLPGADGLDVLRAWREAGDSTPVLVLTARGTLDQRMEGLNLGADDHLGKPFALEELVARLRALVRRRHWVIGALFVHGRVSFNPDSRSVMLGGEVVALSPKAVSLVELFLLNKHAVLSRSAIEEKLYSQREEVSSNAVEVHVHTVRRKLGAAFVKTVHGVGYILGEPL